METKSLTNTEGRALSLEEASALTVLEFESPSAALMTTPVIGSARSVTWVVAMAIVAMCAAAVFIPIEMQVTATGQVIATDDTILVAPYDASIIRSINVNAGQVVHAGDVLVRMDPVLAGSDEAQLQGDVDSYQAQVDELTAESNQVPYQPKVMNAATAVETALFGQHTAQYNSTMLGYEQKIAGLKAQEAQAQGNIQGYQMRLQLAGQLESIQAKLYSMQVGSQVDMINAQDQRTQMAMGLATAVATSQQDDAQIKEMVQERDTFQKQWFAQLATSLATAQTSLSDNLNSLNKARMRRHIVDMKAPVDAVVLSIQPLSVGAVVQPSAQIMQLTPLDSPMEMDVLVPGNDAGWVHPGQPGLIEFTTYPYVRYGTASGTVRYQSSDAFTSIQNNMQVGATMQSQGSPTMPFYDARVTVDQINMHGIPGGFHLRPGMPANVQITVGHRTVLEYLLEKMLPIPIQGMREPS